MSKGLLVAPRLAPACAGFGRADGTEISTAGRYQRIRQKRVLVARARYGLNPRQQPPVFPIDCIGRFLKAPARVSHENPHGVGSTAPLPINASSVDLLGTQAALPVRQERDHDDDHRDDDQRLSVRHGPHGEPPVRRQPAAEFVSPEPPVVND